MNERLLDYLLDELSPGARAAFESDAARVADAERLRPIVTRLSRSTATSGTPRSRPRWSCRARRSCVAIRARTSRAGAACSPSGPWSRPGSRCPVAIGVGAGVLLDGRDAGGGGTDRGRVLALDPVKPAGASAHGTATILARDGRARFTVRGLKPSANSDSTSCGC